MWYVLLVSFSTSELLALRIETLRSKHTSCIDSVRRLVSSISWYSDLVVLNYVLFDDGVAIAQRRSLLASTGIEIRFWNEAIVSWNMRCSLRSANGELMMFVTLRFRILGELCSWVMPKCADRLLELSDIVATF